MKNLDNNTQAFLALVRAGLWETDVKLLPYGDIDYKEVYRLAQEQSVVGLVAAGIEHVLDIKVPKEDALSFVGDALHLEQTNTAMNRFIGVLVDKMSSAGINAILVKGQGIAQCYERPLWRACGDVDLLFNENDYAKAKSFLLSFATNVEKETKYGKHIGMIIDSWVVELHGRLSCSLSKRLIKS